VLHAIPGEDVEAAVVHHRWNGDDQATITGLEAPKVAGVEAEALGGDLDLAQGVPEGWGGGHGQAPG
jgi:hypothetical protein